MVENPIASPCVRCCCLGQNDICMGCGRHLDEIRNWQSASDEKKLEILASARKRLGRRTIILPQK